MFFRQKQEITNNVLNFMMSIFNISLILPLKSIMVTQLYWLHIFLQANEQKTTLSK